MMAIVVRDRQPKVTAEASLAEDAQHQLVERDMGVGAEVRHRARGTELAETSMYLACSFL
jgi:hypothetical protein